jgi:hypothetical protein
VIDAVRAFANRPLPEAARPRLFLAVVAVIAGAVLALAFTGREHPARHATVEHLTLPVSSLPAMTPPPAPATPATTQAAAPEAPSEEGRPDSTAASPARTAAAKHAAGRFLSGYLPYAYGQHRSRAIPAATAGLRHRLATRPPRVPARESRRHPRVVLVQSDGAGRERATVTALVDDGARRYTIVLELARGRSGWLVTDVGS